MSYKDHRVGKKKAQREISCRSEWQDQLLLFPRAIKKAFGKPERLLLKLMSRSSGASYKNAFLFPIEDLQKLLEEIKERNQNATHILVVQGAHDDDGESPETHRKFKKGEPTVLLIPGKTTLSEQVAGDYAFTSLGTDDDFGLQWPNGVASTDFDRKAFEGNVDFVFTLD